MSHSVNIAVIAASALLLCASSATAQTPPAGANCDPACDAGGECAPQPQGCVSRCSPPCPPGLTCSAAGQCGGAPDAVGASPEGSAATTASAASSDPAGLGIRAGIGTDISGGIGFGGIVSYYLGDGLELGVTVFLSFSEETSAEGYNPSTGGEHTYHESTDLVVAGAMANYLWGYRSGESGVFAVAGAGIAVISVEWQESSPSDTSLGSSSGNGSSRSAGGTGAGSVLNLGLGLAHAGVDVRLEAPVIILFDPPGQSAGVLPTFTGTVGYRF